MVDTNGYTSREVAELTGIKITTVRAWVYRKKIRSVKHTNGQWNVVPKTEVERILAEQKDFENQLAKLNEEGK